MKIIESITIRYFRSVYTLTLSQCKDITVISGANDVGKSNILKALNLFFNKQSDFNTNFNFEDDYSILRKEEVKKETIRGQQFISITIQFLRGNRMEKSLPPSFAVTRRWDMHSSEYKQSTTAYARMQQYATKEGIKYSEKTTTTSLSAFLNRIAFIYIPAVKDDKVFNNTLNHLQENLFDTKNKNVLDEPIGKANNAIQQVVGELQQDFAKSTGVNNFVELPNTFSYTRGLLQINTTTTGGIVSINKRGDGIKAHYIPKILNYIAKHSKKIYIWGFEEPENSYEYRRCIQIADEFENEYSQNSQIFITSHSPAFYNNNCQKKAVINVGYENGRTILLNNSDNLDEELGYKALYQKFIDELIELQRESEEKDRNIKELKESLFKTQNPIILTEGKTDATLLKLAISKLNIKGYDNWNIKPILIEKTTNNQVLLNFLRNLKDNAPQNRLIIGIFDRDTVLEIIIDGEKIDVRDKKYIKIAKNIYCFAIPVPHNRQETNQISIEHYFTDDEIKTEKNGKRLFLGNEFYPTGVFKGQEDYFYKAGAKVASTIKVIEHETNTYVTKRDGTGDYSISKAMFVKSIEDNNEGFSNISFAEFKKIFDVVEDIIKDQASNASGSNNDQL